MQGIAELLADTFKPEEKKARRGSELDAIIGEIAKVVPITKEYGFSYWRGQISRKAVGFSDMVGILKELDAMDLKYNKGATLVNILKKYPRRVKPKKEEKLKTLNLF